MDIGADYSGNDFYCDVALPNIAKMRVLHDDAHVLAFHHTKPFWQHHVVVVPKRHIPSLTQVEADQTDDLLALLAVVRDVAALMEAEHGQAAVLTNLGHYQDSKHLHVHVYSGPRSFVGQSTNIFREG